MKKKSFFWHIYIPFFIATLVYLIMIILYTHSSLKDFYYQSTSEELEAKAYLFETIYSNNNMSLNTVELEKICKSLGQKTKTRFTVTAPDGRVLVDSYRDPESMENHLDRPEIIEALKGKIGKAIRVSPTVNKKMMYVGVPIFSGKNITAIIRTSVPINDIDEHLGFLYFKIITFLVIAYIITTLLILSISRRMTKPLEMIKNHAEQYVKGQIITKMPPSKIREIDSLSNSLNEIVIELDNRFRTITEQRNQIETVFSSMEEGIIAVDSSKRVLTLNQSAAKFLKIDITNSVGKSIQELVRKPEFIEFINSVFVSDDHVEIDVLIQNPMEILLKLHGTKLVYGKKQEIGALIVLNDITRLNKLEKIRKDFVANVSHELKTPITSIKGFIETILDGAIDNKEDVIRFLNIVQKHANRLDSIIDDLLTLSRLEQDDAKNEIQLNEDSIKNVLMNAIEICSSKAKNKNIKINLECDSELKAKINSQLLEHAISNLLDNAIKFSPDNEKVDIAALKTADNKISISVKDHGCGIPEEHLSRLTERFYRVDKSHSRKLEGTGLGLSITKHITKIHNGNLTIESKPGKGSTFSIIIPEKHIQ